MNKPLDSPPKTHNTVAPTTIEVIALDELTSEEQLERLRLERVVERSFYEAGKALQQLRERKLYRSTHKTFEQYCSNRFGYHRRQPYHLIEAAVVVDNLREKCAPLVHILPTSERQVRPLTNLEPEKQREVWLLAVEEAGGKVPSGRIVKDVVERIMERTKVPNPYRVGEVCQIIPKDNPELKGKSGCWCIVTHVGDYSCTIATWESEYVVKLEHLKSFEYMEEECAFMEQLCLRLKKLHQLGNLDTGAYWILNGMGKLSTPYLTSLQEKLLGVLEQEYEIG